MTSAHVPSPGQSPDTAAHFGGAEPYRTTVTTTRPFSEVIALADQLLAAWLKQEGAEEPPPAGAAPGAERLRPGPRILLDRDSGSLNLPEPDDPPGPSAPLPAAHPAGSGRYARRRLRTPVPHGTHQLTVTIATSAAGPGGTRRGRGARSRSGPAPAEHPEAGPGLDQAPVTWVRLEAEHLAAGTGARPAGRVPIPELARTLLALIEATDGSAQIGPLPRVVTPAEVDTLIDELCDPARTLPTIVASVPPSVPLDTWLASTVHPLVRHLTGLAALYVLDHAALPHFNVAFEYHKVYGGAVRTYQPEVDPASRADSARHSVMPRHRIEEDVRRAAALIAREPRRAAAELPLPALLAAVPVLQLPAEPRRRPHPVLPPQSRSGGAAEHPAGEETATEATAAEEQAPDHGERQARADELQRIKRSLLQARHRERRLLAENSEQHTALRHISDQVRALTEQLRVVAGPDAADELRFAADPFAADPFTIDSFTIDPFSTDPFSTEALSVGPVGEDVDAPASFGDLVGRFDEFPLLEFTGDFKETLALDGQCAGAGWARLTWDGLTALQEYAAAAVRGEAHGDFKQWCEHTPPGCHRFPPRKAVRGESRTVESHTKWKRERMLPVPECVDSSRRAFMGAHLRIGGGRTAPRLHYLDDCSGSGRIYVGYIGLHLTNTRTN